MLNDRILKLRNLTACPAGIYPPTCLRHSLTGERKNNFSTPSRINQCLRELTDLDAFGISLAQIAGEGPLIFLIKKHRIKRTRADTGFAASAKIRVDLNGTGCWLF
jgi:hypothetical protein